jgi:hypothetical protein
MDRPLGKKDVRMKMLQLITLSAMTGVGVPLCFGASAFEPLTPLAQPEPIASLNASPVALPHGAVAWGVGSYGAAQEPLRVGAEPFSSIAVQIKMGLAGPGIDLATPVGSKLNLRAGVSFFQYNPSFTVDGEIINGTIQLRTVNEAFDFYPFGNGFRISPGMTFYNGNHITATTSVPGGQTFTLDNVQYISGPNDPIRGTFDLAFGNQLAPSLTIGWGNMIPRKGGHWSFPFEIGAEYIGKQPRIALQLAGTACQGGTAPPFCQTVASDPTTQQNVLAEQQLLNSNVPRQLRFFPIVSIGVSYKFSLQRGNR